MTFDAEKIVKTGKLIQATNTHPIPWYGHNLVEIYLLDGRNYRVFRNDCTDPSWWKWEEVFPKQITKIIWETDQ